MLQETIKYDLPRINELTEEFAKAAKVSDNGNKIELGNYTASKRGMWSRLFIAFGARWQIDTKETTESLTKGHTLLFPEMAQSDIINMMARMHAEDSATEQDKQEGLKQALQAKLNALTP